MPKKKLTGRGGPGRGQGKKPGVMGVKGTRSMGFSPDILEFLNTLDGKNGKPSASQYTEDLIRTSPAFRSFAAAGQGKKGKKGGVMGKSVQKRLKVQKPNVQRPEIPTSFCKAGLLATNVGQLKTLLELLPDDLPLSYFEEGGLKITVSNNSISAPTEPFVRFEEIEDMEAEATQ